MFEPQGSIPVFEPKRIPFRLEDVSGSSPGLPDRKSPVKFERLILLSIHDVRHGRTCAPLSRARAS